MDNIRLVFAIVLIISILVKPTDNTGPVVCAACLDIAFKICGSSITLGE